MSLGDVRSIKLLPQRPDFSGYRACKARDSDVFSAVAVAAGLAGIDVHDGSSSVPVKLRPRNSSPRASQAESQPQPEARRRASPVHRRYAGLCTLHGTRPQLEPHARRGRMSSSVSRASLQRTRPSAKAATAPFAFGASGVHIRYPCDSFVLLPPHHARLLVLRPSCCGRRPQQAFGRAAPEGRAERRRRRRQAPLSAAFGRTAVLPRESRAGFIGRRRRLGPRFTPTDAGFE